MDVAPFAWHSDGACPFKNVSLVCVCATLAIGASPTCMPDVEVCFLMSVGVLKCSDGVGKCAVAEGVEVGVFPLG
jgi:hypothetical protein